MIAEAIKKIEDMALDGKDVSIVPLKSEPTGKYLIVKSDGTFEERTPESAFHGEVLSTPTDLATFIADHKSAETPAIFYDDTRVTYVADIEDRRDRATVALRLTPQYLTLDGLLKSGKTLSQKDLVRLLRIDLYGCMGGMPNLLPTVRNLTFDVEGQSTGNIQHGRESMGRKIDAKVTGSELLPEEFPLDLPVFENHRFIARIMVALEIDTAMKTFRVTPYPMEMRRAIDDGLASVVETLTEADDAPPIYRGSPE